MNTKEKQKLYNFDSDWVLKSTAPYINPEHKLSQNAIDRLNRIANLLRDSDEKKSPLFKMIPHKTPEPMWLATNAMPVPIPQSMYKTLTKRMTDPRHVCFISPRC